MQEYVMNLHMHTVLSDGTATHAEIIDIAKNSNLDIVLITDHNLLMREAEGFYSSGDKQLLVLIGEEVHDIHRIPEKNHLLVIGAKEELSKYADNPQNLIDQTNKAGGMSFLAHPIDPGAKLVPDTDISWVDWNVERFTGIEIWNGLTEYKSVVTSWPRAIFYAYWPQAFTKGPYREALEKWDSLLQKNIQVVAIGGSDAHGRYYRKGPFRRRIFPYAFHFKGINTHLLLKNKLSDILEKAKTQVYEALKSGSAYIGYDLPAKTNGFRMWAKMKTERIQMGEEKEFDGKAQLHAKFPRKCEIILYQDGKEILRKTGGDQMQFPIREKGVYRLEAYLPYLGRRRTWIISNPIYFR